ncbi:putative membrane protein YeaQ/YmgE (transglycosylase-associated protein family) [Bartonella fuyuanensis]|uniref:Putative membrane protein YeaQ/YmgE (Transglycosylase-associated protein family) n=1 Tax=Bartonella fuyuanensis TaxID=1460968 RepID=A0A840E8A1_9HYPH|nr:GlsB/YeaQ/YmgE family stress response membrane protein [Bartonella fuyuanensis]MBB4077306.1 putative membrane protein YeaQ/YmgE (transglycosylase-associated protein family) [Bartonella fuyuanensis]
MENANIGWIAAIIIGGLAGWAAQYIMKSQTGILLNIILGIIGAALASFLFSLLGVNFAGWPGYLISGFLGACILIWIGQRIRS